ncbi:MAG TPA: prolipoprotein diacylglyceryl transferase [Chryseosolibacter sp.]|nr:prolipoprotein diacylglyceryl transferase [Chryseosolibacter sp.]
MYPALFEVGSVTVYSYGFFIALGILTGIAYLVVEGKKEVGLTFDQANALFLLIFFAAIIGGKLFLLLEQPSAYLQEPRKLFSGSGFVFYGSFLLAVPTMWWFFKRYRLHPYKMLDVMAITTCFVHMFGRVGCFLAGCCYGKPTDSFAGVTFSDPACYAKPLNTPLYPTQLFEAFYILLVMAFLFILKNRRRFYGQVFLSYLMIYAVGRIIIEFFRGDISRGFVIEDYISHSQFIALSVLGVVVFIYFRWRKTMLPMSNP